MCTGQCCFKFWDGLLVYEEPRVIRIHSFFLTFIYWMACIGAGLFIGVYLIWYSQGYQYFDPVESAVTTKLFGVAKPNVTGLGQFRQVWDNADYMVPPKENGAFTVITSVFVTPKQSQGTCDEDPTIRGAQCEVDANCTADKALLYGNGVMTGKCIFSTYMPSVKVCEISAWCPVEFDDPAKRIRLATENFTVFIRNNVKFPSFHANRQNIPNNMNDKELETCMFDPGHPRNKHCPVFKINTIVEETGHSFSSMVSEGGVIEIIIDWDCNFDCSDECLPTYSFHRLDRLENAPSRGFHLRYADHYADSTDQFFRTLYRAYGIRIIVSVHGSGRKFSKRVTAKTIGSGLSFFGIAAFIVSKGILRLYKMCCKRKCCLEDKYCTNTLQWCWTGCYDWCFCKPLDKSMRTEQDKNADDLRATTFVFRDALKTCSRRCVLSGERYSSEPEIDQSSTALDTTRQPINSQAGNDVIVRTNPAFGLPSDVENSL